MSRARLDRDVHRVLTQPMRDEHRRESFDVAASLPRVGTGIACRRAELVGTDAERDALWQCPCSLDIPMIRASAT